MAASSDAAAVDPNEQRQHHKKVEEYEERPKYRKGRRDKAVKVRWCLCCICVSFDLATVYTRCSDTGLHC